METRNEPSFNIITQSAFSIKLQPISPDKDLIFEKFLEFFSNLDLRLIMVYNLNLFFTVTIVQTAFHFWVIEKDCNL